MSLKTKAVFTLDISVWMSGTHPRGDTLREAGSGSAPPGNSQQTLNFKHSGDSLWEPGSHWELQVADLYYRPIQCLNREITSYIITQLIIK